MPRPLLCGLQVSEGSGKILVLAVGDNSEWGKTISLVTHSGDEQTPLQEKLAHVAATVGKIGATVAATCFIALLVRHCEQVFVVHVGSVVHQWWWLQAPHDFCCAESKQTRPHYIIQLCSLAMLVVAGKQQ